MTFATAPAEVADQVVQRFGLMPLLDEPLCAAAGGQELGRLRVHTGPDDVAAVVVVTLATADMAAQLMCGFTSPDSAVPHLALDVVVTAEAGSLHLDVLPRVDVATHPAYVEQCLRPLGAPAAELVSTPGVDVTALPLHQLALMSRWVLCCSLLPTAYDAAERAVAAYSSHWAELVAELPTQVREECGDTDLAGRDSRLRARLFSADLDPVWGLLTALIGAASAERVRRMMADPAAVTRP